MAVWIWSKSHSSFNACAHFPVCGASHQWLTHCRVIGCNCTLVTSAVAEWFDHAWLQKFVNELALLLCKAFDIGVWHVKGKVTLTLVHLVFYLCTFLQTDKMVFQSCLSYIYWCHIHSQSGIKFSYRMEVVILEDSSGLTAHNWQKRKRVFLTCPCHKIYRDEAVGLKSCKCTWKIMIFVKMWNLGQYRENWIFCQ